MKLYYEIEYKFDIYYIDYRIVIDLQNLGRRGDLSQSNIKKIIDRRRIFLAIKYLGKDAINDLIILIQ